MQKRGLLLGLLGLAMLLGIFFIHAVSAEILVGDVASVYNIGDEMNLPVTVSSSSDASDFLTSNLACTGSDNASSNSVEVYKGTLSLKAGSKKTIALSVSFGKSLIGDLNGMCVISSNYNGVFAESRQFELTSDVSVELDLSGIIFSPEDNINIIGHANKKNGDALNGFVGVDIPAMNMKVYGDVKNGAFNFSLTIPKDAHAGNYGIVATAYEKDSNGNIMNSGEASGQFTVRHIMSGLDIALSSQSIMPGNDEVFNVLLSDQAGDALVEDVSVILYYPNGTIIEKRLVKSGSAETLSIKNNDIPGYWKISASLGELSATKTFFVDELEQANFQLANDTMIITNTGNIDYAKPVAFGIGGKKEIIQVNISVGQTKKYRISAPDGNYDISVDDGTSVSSFGSSFLTGNAISVQDLSLTSSLPLNILIWGIIILVVAAIALYAYRRISARSFFGRMPGFGRSEPAVYNNIQMPQQMQMARAMPAENNEPRTTFGFKREEERTKERIESIVPSVPFWRKNREEKEYAKPSETMDRAERQQSSVVCLNIKNLGEIEGSRGGAMGALDRALSKAKSLRAKIYIDNNYRVIIFDSTITHDNSNETRAINAAKQIEEVLTEYNKMHVMKIDFGVGINSGELIGEAKDGGFKFTSVGNTISSAKRISDAADKEILLSEPFHRRTAGSVKVDFAKGYWKIKRIINREKNSEFIERFVSRQRKK